MERMKSSGPSIEPWWMPWDRGAVEEVQLLTWMSCFLSGGDLILTRRGKNGAVDDVKRGDCFCAV